MFDGTTHDNINVPCVSCQLTWRFGDVDLEAGACVGHDKRVFLAVRDGDGLGGDLTIVDGVPRCYVNRRLTAPGGVREIYRPRVRAWGIQMNNLNITQDWLFITGRKL